MKKESKMGFAIEMEFTPEFFSETGQHNSFYEDDTAEKRALASGSFRIPLQSPQKR